MNTTTKTIEFVSVSFLAVLLLALFLIHSTAAVNAATFAPIAGQMDVGASGQDVTNLQTFLASNYYVYPQGLVTGYYGNLTANAVAQFQLNYGLPAVGRVGPLTLNKINSVIASGLGIDITAPVISNMLLQPGRTTAMASWTTNEPATGKVYYSVLPLQSTEATGNFMEPTITTTGVANVNNATLETSQNFMLQNLQPGTVYYYMIVSTDASGNVSVSVPSSFTTTP